MLNDVNKEHMELLNLRKRCSAQRDEIKRLNIKIADMESNYCINCRFGKLDNDDDLFGDVICSQNVTIDGEATLPGNFSCAFFK